MIKSRLVKGFVLSLAGLLISCNMNDNSGLEQAINEVKDSQEVLLKKMNTLEKSVNNLALANKNKPADKQQPPKADPNKVYNIPVGDSYSKGPKDAAVTIIEWSDFQ